MELTLKRLLEQAEFTEKRGKYESKEVDDFLDRAAAMAAKVETKLTETMEQARGGSAPAPAAVDVEAEVDRRVAARMAEVATERSTGEDESADEMRRTLVLAQRTADAAIREAREDAEKLVSEAESRAASIRSDIDADAATARTNADREVADRRREAEARLAGEIAELEGIREALRSDVDVLERHVEEQRSQIRSSVGELQRLLDDPAGFRLAPTPVLLDPEVPDRPTAASDPEPAAPPAVAPAAPFADIAPDPEPAAPAPVDLQFDEVDHAAPGVEETVDPGPPTARMAAIDLRSAAEPEADEEPSDEEPGDEDAFLAELRKAMADDEPLGPRDTEKPRVVDDLDDDPDGRNWRFGKKR